ncbi:MAG TPA: hypothetical protein VK597_05335, partial [Inquilinus sp.]|nr:hypothetical protein [Inquilinus sp.]
SAGGAGSQGRSIEPMPGCDLSGLIRKVEAPLDPVEAIVDAIESSADFGTELGAVALQMRQMPLDRRKADALLALFRPHFRHVGADGAQKLDDEAFGFGRHGTNLR